MAVEGSESWWPDADTEAVLPALIPYQAEPTRFIEVFNRGPSPSTIRLSPRIRGWWWTQAHKRTFLGPPESPVGP